MSGKAIVFRWANNDSDSLTMFFSQDGILVDMSLRWWKFVGQIGMASQRLRHICFQLTKILLRNTIRPDITVMADWA